MIIEDHAFKKNKKMQWIKTGRRSGDTGDQNAACFRGIDRSGAVDHLSQKSGNIIMIPKI